MCKAKEIKDIVYINICTQIRDLLQDFITYLMMLNNINKNNKI